jgi:site-specific recombinase XerD
MKPKEEWLKEIKSTNRKRYSDRFDEFCQWLGKTDTELVADYKQANDKDAWSKRMGSVIVQYYQARLQTGYSINSARSDTIAPRSFFSSQCREVTIKKGAIAKPQVAQNQHSFSLVEFQKMFHFGDAKSKAILSTEISLGWSPIDFLSLEVDFIKPHVEKAITEKFDFVQFLYSRQKTNETIIAHLGKDAIESLDAYLKLIPSDAKFLWYSPSDHSKAISNKALNDLLKAMVKQANVMTTGKVEFNELRKYTFSTLQKYGMTESESRVCVGKTVSADVLTYLINLKDTLLEKYKKVYQNGLKLSSNGNNGRIDNLQTTVDTLVEVLRELLKEKLKEKGYIVKHSGKPSKQVDYQKLLKKLEKVKP